MDSKKDSRYTELDLIRLLESMIPNLPDTRLMAGAEFGPLRQHIDIAYEHLGVINVVEVRGSVPQTAGRLTFLLERLSELRSRIIKRMPGKNFRFVLAIPGVLTPEKISRIQISGFDLWDRETIIGLASETGHSYDAYTLFGQEDEEPRQRSTAEELQLRLRETSCGRPEWSSYQRLCGNILEYLFCPPLEKPIPESANAPRVNRRDFVMANYATEGFWHFLRLHYRADFLVIDAKNYCGLVSKNHILQLANYLSHHGTGLFGVIITRNGADNAATRTCREQWALHGKMIVTLNDADVSQMLETKKSGDDPGALIRQKIEDFRLGM